MIVELTNTMSSRAGISKRLTYQKTLFPAPAAKDDIHESLGKRSGQEVTDVSRESIAENSVQTISNQRKFHLGRTTSPSPRGAIHERCDGFSMDQAERANFGPLSATGHLSQDLSVSRQ